MARTVRGRRYRQCPTATLQRPCPGPRHSRILIPRMTFEGRLDELFDQEEQEEMEESQALGCIEVAGG
ncbi:hypothetical protein N657DRAFT_650796, partial [Parathielavia appendiculata]